MENIILLSSEPTLVPQDTVYQLVNENITNCSLSNSTCETDQVPMPRQIIILILYIITCAVALIGNFLVCQIIFTSRKLKTTTYILVANLAISDILGAVAIPSQWLFCSTYILDHFTYGERVCGAMKSIQIQSYYVSTLTMTVIAIDRYQLIATPMKSRMKPKIPIVIIWVIASSFTATTTISMRVSEFFTPHALISCRIVFKIAVPISNFIFRKIRVIILILTQFVIPLTICGILYTKTVIIIWKRSGLGEMTEEQALYMNSSKWRTIKMLIIVVIVFMLSWLPVHTMHFIDFFITPLLPSKCNTSMVYALAYWLGISSCSFNPFIYWWFNSTFRKGMLSFLCCWPCFENRNCLGMKITRDLSPDNTTRSRSKSNSRSSGSNNSRQRSNSVFYISSNKHQQVNSMV